MAAVCRVDGMRGRGDDRAAARLGLCGPELRLPMTQLTLAHQPIVEAALKASGLL